MPEPPAPAGKAGGFSLPAAPPPLPELANPDEADPFCTAPAPPPPDPPHPLIEL